MNILLVASAVGAIGDGLTGGVSDVLRNTAGVLAERGHRVDILAGAGSHYDGRGRLIGIEGKFQPTIVAGAGDKENYPIVPNALIANYWRYAFAHRGNYDVILNLCQDWLPYYLTPFFDVPVLHLANVCDENTAVSDQIMKTAYDFPGRVATISHAQATALGIEGDAFECGLCIDITRYLFSAAAEAGTLVWCARISPEKGLEDAAEIARRTARRLLVCGYMQDAAYFDRVSRQYKDVIDYRGFLGKAALAKELGRAEALLCTHKWLEAFGLTALEALACGTPVITYNRGGPAETIAHGETGFVVPADNVSAATAYVSRLHTLSREHCRRTCEELYGLKSYGDRIEGWLTSQLTARGL